MEEKFRRREFLRLLSSNIFLDIAAAFRQKALLKNISQICKFRFMQFAGTYKGFNDGYLKMSLLKDKFYYPPEKIHDHHEKDFEELEINYSGIKQKIGK